MTAGVDQCTAGVPDEDVGVAEPEPTGEPLEAVAERARRERSRGPAQSDERRGEDQDRQAQTTVEASCIQAPAVETGR